MTDTQTAKVSSQPKESRSEAHDQATRHRYDNPMLDARGFLLAVMYDRDTALHHRLDAASKLLALYPDDWPEGEPVLMYHIGGITVQ